MEISFSRPPGFSLTSATKGMDLPISANIWSVEHGDCGKATTLVGDWDAELVDFASVFFSSATEGEVVVAALAGVEHEDDGDCVKASTPLGEHGDDDADEVMIKKRKMIDRIEV